MTIDPDTLAWLADFVLQSTALLALGLLAHFLLSHRSAAKRYSLLLLTAFGIPLLLLLPAFLPTQHLPLGPALIEPVSMKRISTQSIEFWNAHRFPCSS